MTKYSRSLHQEILAERANRLDAMKRMADKQAKVMMQHGRQRLSDIYTHACTKLFDDDDEAAFMYLSHLRRIPVSIEEFVESTDFLGGVDMELWPQIANDLSAVNTDFLLGEEQVTEYIDSGATGTGKTAKAHVTQAYQLYHLHCLSSPQSVYRLAKQTPIIMVFTSSNWATTRDVLFRPFMQLVTAMPFFRRYTTWNTDKSSVLEFDNNLVVEPVNATGQGIIGRAIIGGHIDEANFMAVVQGSKRMTSADGRGGVFDQAEQFYRAIKLRRKSRFSKNITVPGMIIVSSSTRHLDDFVDRRVDEVRESNEPNVRVFRHKQYEVQPKENFSRKTFRLLVGTPEYSTRILGDDDVSGLDYPEGAMVLDVPENYRYEFMHRPEDALRDVCGISTVNLSPFITQRVKIVEAVERWHKDGNAHAVMRANVDLVDHGMPKLVPELLDADTETKRFVHIDLSKSKDRCGIVMLRVDRMVLVKTEEGLYERVPHYVVELAISIQPSQAKELDIAEVRNWVVALKAEHDVPIYMITYDGFNSAESIQALRKIGIRSELVSMDRTDEPYQVVRRALYQDRLDLPDNPVLKTELIQLDQDQATGRVDHPPKGSKDISDALAGAVYAASTSRIYRTKTYFTDADGNRLHSRQTSEVSSLG